MIVVDCEQGTPEWMAARAGLVTASRVSDVLAKIKSGEAAARRNYRAELLCERLTGVPYGDGFTSKEMLWGQQWEPIARAEYEVLTDNMVEKVGFVLHPTLEFCGASPDGLVNSDGLIEIKCPNTATHIAYLLAGEVPAEYRLQMHWQMACTGRAWCDFVSYDPRLPDHLQLFIKRLERDEREIERIEAEVVKFLGEVDELIDKLPKAAMA